MTQGLLVKLLQKISLLFYWHDVMQCSEERGEEAKSEQGLKG